MTVEAILQNFRQALSAVAPHFQRVEIPWQRPAAYDEWDSVASALFRALVVEVLRENPESFDRDGLALPDYDLLVDDYSKYTVLIVENPLLSAGRHVFHAFGTASQPFDLVETRRVSEEGKPLTSQLEACPVGGSRFRLEAGAMPG
jgi:hypothetical protein